MPSQSGSSALVRCGSRACRRCRERAIRPGASLACDVQHAGGSAPSRVPGSPTTSTRPSPRRASGRRWPPRAMVSAPSRARSAGACQPGEGGGAEAKVRALGEDRVVERPQHLAGRRLPDRGGAHRLAARAVSAAASGPLPQTSPITIVQLPRAVRKASWKSPPTWCLPAAESRSRLETADPGQRARARLAEGHWRYGPAARAACVVQRHPAGSARRWAMGGRGGRSACWGRAARAKARPAPSRAHFRGRRAPNSDGSS